MPQEAPWHSHEPQLQGRSGLAEEARHEGADLPCRRRGSCGSRPGHAARGCRSARRKLASAESGTDLAVRVLPCADQAGGYNGRAPVEPQRAWPLVCRRQVQPGRSEEHTSELQSLMRISYAVFCLKKKKAN